MKRDHASTPRRLQTAPFLPAAPSGRRSRRRSVASDGKILLMDWTVNLLLLTFLAALFELGGSGPVGVGLGRLCAVLLLFLVAIVISMVID